MSGQHRRNQRLGEPGIQFAGGHAIPGDIGERCRDAADLRRRLRQRVRAPPAILVDVFGDVAEVREVGESAYDIERDGNRQVVQQRGEFGANLGGLRRRRAPEPDRRLAHGLDARIAVLPGLRAQHVAQQAAQKARVFLQRRILERRIRQRLDGL
jgi:hypothetical protein